MILEFQARRLDHGVHTTISRTKTMQKFGEEVAVCRTRNKDRSPSSFEKAAATSSTSQCDRKRRVSRRSAVSCPQEMKA